MFEINKYFESKKSIIDQVLHEKWLAPTTTFPQILHEAMHYSLFAPGKRLRPILVLATAEALGIPESDVLPIAASLEMIHVFSLIHDDLPSMDDDDLRRGRPTNHKVYGEAIAILAGDALMAQSFIPLSELDDKKYKSENILKIIKAIAKATGTCGMIAGQVVDLLSEGKQISIEQLKTLHQHKTGALIKVAIESPALLIDLAEIPYKNLMNYAEAIGLAFQIADDILDIEGGTSLGKDIGSDIKKNKATYPSLMGINNAKIEAKKTVQRAIASLETFDNKALPLREIAKFIIERNY